MAAPNEVVGTLQDAALKRKNRLQAWKDKKKLDSASKDKDQVAEKEVLPRPIFRSYKPHDETLKENTLPQAKPANLEDQVKEELEATKSKPVIEGLDLTNLAPRKPDWDLKRDVAKKLEKLERQTQRAIAELIRERLKQNVDEDFATVVSVGAEVEESAKYD